MVQVLAGVRRLNGPRETTEDYMLRSSRKTREALAAITAREARNTRAEVARARQSKSGHRR